MDKKLAELLIDELANQKDIAIKPNREKYMDLLTSLEINPHSFCEKIPNNRQTSLENRVINTLELRRIIVNSRIEEYEPTRVMKINNILKKMSPRKIYSSDALFMKLETYPYLTEMMKKSEFPFSLLIKQKRYSIDNGKLKNVTRPSIILYKKSNDFRVLSWGDVNMTIKYMSVPYRKLLSIFSPSLQSVEEITNPERKIEYKPSEQQ